MNHSWSLTPKQLPFSADRLQKWWNSQPSSNLLILVNDGNAMIPFGPAIAPITGLAEQETAKPAHIYRFTVYPDDYLYLWKNPTKAVLLESILTEVVQQDTLVLILSDGGAMTNQYNEEVEVGLSSFLDQLLTRTQNVLWLNPLPEIRWQETTAQAISHKLKGKMLSFDTASQIIASTPI